MSKARVISVQDGLRIREEQQKKDAINTQKKQRLLNTVQPKQQSSPHQYQPPSHSETPKRLLLRSIVQIFFNERI